MQSSEHEHLLLSCIKHEFGRPHSAMSQPDLDYFAMDNYSILGQKHEWSFGSFAITHSVFGGRSGVGAEYRTDFTCGDLRDFLEVPVSAPLTEAGPLVVHSLSAP